MVSCYFNVFYAFLPHMKFIFVKASTLGPNVTVCLLYTLLYILFAKRPEEPPVLIPQSTYVAIILLDYN